MRAIVTFGVVGVFLLLLFAVAVAGEGQESADKQAMPEMGPPLELQEMDYLVGIWDVVTKSKWDPKAENWEESKGICSYSYVAGRAAIQEVYSGQVMGMHFHGFGLHCFDRETGKWQSTWIDNMSARITIYEGEKKDGKTVMFGEDRWDGMTMLSRTTIFNETATSYEMTMEYSYDGGKTYQKVMMATYTKRQEN